MKIILSLLFLTYFLSCDSKAPTQTTMEQEQATIHQEPPSTHGQESLSPGTVLLNVKILETFESKQSICGLDKNNVCAIEIMEVIETSSGIVNAPSKNQQIRVSFLLPMENMEANTVYEVKAKESLCPDASTTYFTVLRHKKLD
ncbi:MAG: hypothetical protein AB3N16_15585 [Flavobacteriaceae bacterium]